MERKRQKAGTVETSAAVLDEPQVARERCNHYWIIDSPRGPTSGGVCKFCGARKEFDNWGPDAFRYGEAPDITMPGVIELAAEDKSEGGA